MPASTISVPEGPRGAANSTSWRVPGACDSTVASGTWKSDEFLEPAAQDPALEMLVYGNEVGPRRLAD